MYTVGNCTYPMELAKCPACGATIGGQSHVTVKGTTRVEAPSGGVSSGELPLGYITGSASSIAEYGFLQRIDPPCVAMLRLSLHALLLCGILIDPTTLGSAVCDLVKLRSGPVSTISRLSERVELDMKLFGQTMSLRDQYVPVAVTLVFRRHFGLSSGALFTKLDARNAFESNFQKEANVILKAPNFIDMITEVHSASAKDFRFQTILKIVGRDLYNYISRPGGRMLFALPVPSIERLFRARKPVTFMTFQNSFYAQGMHGRYRLLTALLREETRLEKTKYIINILEWHALLFEFLSSRILTRDDARDISNLQVVESIDEARRLQALQVLDGFCTAFNRSFHLVELIYECQRNPFLTPGQGINLAPGSATPVLMSRETSIVFSVPSMSPVRDNVDAPGLCTIRLLDVLQGIHNDFLPALMADGDGNRPRTAVAAVAAAAAAAGGGGGVNASVTLIDYKTSSLLLQRKVMNYDRSRDLMPLVWSFASSPRYYTDSLSSTAANAVTVDASSSPLSSSSSSSSSSAPASVAESEIVEATDIDSLETPSFQFGCIQNSLISGLFANIGPLAVRVVPYRYSGEIRSSGKLTALAARIPQENLSKAAVADILVDLETKAQGSTLLGYLDNVVNFLTTLSDQVRRLDGSLLLTDFVLHTLLLEAELWSQVCPPSVARAVQLKHLQV